MSNTNLIEKNGWIFKGNILSGGYASLMRVEILKRSRDGKVKSHGERLFGISNTREVVRVGFLRRKVATLRFDPSTNILSIEE